MPRYIAVNKPYGMLSQFTGEEGQKTLAELGLPGGVYAAGRLDKDSEGLLILSDDGKFIKGLLDPDHGHKRIYWVQVEGDPSNTEMAKLSAGVKIKKYKTKPCEAKILNPQPEIAPRNPPIRVRQSIPTSWIEMILTEGKNRQVRRMTAAVGFPTLRLIRTQIGKLELGDISTGAWREVSRKEILG
ncbi:MAG: pseudouridine synthase [Proteobacteria bacterium]|nr:pseudouridine synthase [Pseudomonadota bacterium]